MNTLKHISKEAIRELPLYRYKGSVEVVHSPDRLEEVVKDLIKEPILGFDVETKPAFKKGQFNDPSLVQLARQDEAFLIQIGQMGGFFSLKEILESNSIKKVGVGLRDDISKLRNIEPFEPAQFVDITKLTEPLGYENKGLRGMVGLFFQKRLSKGAQVTDWSRKQLSRNQIDYAAADAAVSLELYLHVLELEKVANGSN